MNRLKLLLKELTGTINKKAYILLLTLICSLQSPSANSGTLPEDDAGAGKKFIEVQLIGATDLGVVQLFEYLLGKTQLAKSVDPAAVTLQPVEPQACRAVWFVDTGEGETSDLVSQLAAIIKQLDPNIQNEVLYDSPFVVTEENLNSVKQAAPLIISAESAVFSITGGTEVLETISDFEYDRGVNRWLQLPGAGFD